MYPYVGEGARQPDSYQQFYSRDRQYQQPSQGAQGTQSPYYQGQYAAPVYYVPAESGSQPQDRYTAASLYGYGGGYPTQTATQAPPPGGPTGQPTQTSAAQPPQPPQAQQASQPPQAGQQQQPAGQQQQQQGQQPARAYTYAYSGDMMMPMMYPAQGQHMQQAPAPAPAGQPMHSAPTQQLIQQPQLAPTQQQPQQQHSAQQQAQQQQQPATQQLNGSAVSSPHITAQQAQVQQQAQQQQQQRSMLYPPQPMPPQYRQQPLPAMPLPAMSRLAPQHQVPPNGVPNGSQQQPGACVPPNGNGSRGGSVAVHRATVSTHLSAIPPTMLVTDPTGQTAPPGIKPRVTTTLWEDEGTTCFQVEARGFCVARREDNDMINGTKLLNVAGMTRGRRDGLLKGERNRHVVKAGAMHLKGVWIPYDRALDFANKERIVDLLYPLFVTDIKSVLYHPNSSQDLRQPVSSNQAQVQPQIQPVQIQPPVPQAQAQAQAPQHTPATGSVPGVVNPPRSPHHQDGAENEHASLPPLAMSNPKPELDESYREKYYYDGEARVPYYPERISYQS